MRLHILPDEKIINRTIQYFEQVWPEQNKFIIISKRKECRYVKQYSSDQIFIEKYGSKSFWRRVGDIEDYNSVIIHYLTLEASKFILKINHPNISWIEWGGDMYNSFLKRKGYKLYGDKLAKYKETKDRIFNVLSFGFLNLIKYRIFKIRYKSVFKIKYFIPDSMYEEYPLFLRYYPEFSHLKYREIFYYPIHEIIGSTNINKRVCGNNIIIGNSASYTNNHLEIFEILSKKKIKNNIVVPLSYGGNHRYKERVKKLGKELWGDNFVPLLEFLKISDYNDILFKSSVFIYGNYRQEAVGNILFALYIGGRVFLQKDNPLYAYYRSIGLIVFSVDQIDNELINTPLSDNEYNINKRIIEDKYSNSRLLELIRQSFPDE